MRSFSTPMMQQYMAIKQQYMDCLVFFRLGDFYELFLDDAKIGAEVLGITLTKRPRGKDGDIPMAGVPHHAAHSYIGRLIKAGHKVAVCEQVSEPNEKGIVDREVVRVITPGTVLDEHILKQKENHYIMSVSVSDTLLGIAVADISTGDFQISEIALTAPLEQTLPLELSRWSPAECVISETLYHTPAILKVLAQHEGMNITPLADWERITSNASGVLKKHFEVKSLGGFGLDGKHEAQNAAALLLSYLSYTQKERIGHIRSIHAYTPDDYVMLDPATIRNLELFTTLRDREERGTLVSVLDHTHTAMGGRMLRQWIRRPLRDKKAIDARLTTAAELVTDTRARTTLREQLKTIYDIERIIARLSVGLGTPLDVVALKQSLVQARALSKNLLKRKAPLLKMLHKNIPKTLDTVATLIETRIVADPPREAKEGGIIREGVDRELDSLRAELHDHTDWMRAYEEKQRKHTSISSLKVKYNGVFGYYIEISKANLDRVPDTYTRKQTMANGERFTTSELSTREKALLQSQDQIYAREYALFLETIEAILQYTTDLSVAAQAVATLDCLLSFAHHAHEYRYAKPTLRSDGVLRITQGRHPMVEQVVDEPFVPNDLLLNRSDHQLLLITGPNMAGKSVLLRQTALIALLAHMGSFVPADKAQVSLLDRIFVRSGASDVITRGLSTFMVEMVETAYILNHATRDSLIVMDEIGRGTSTYDGISIAWAVAQYLVMTPERRAKTLFATHYHELHALEDEYPDSIKNYSLAAVEHDGEPVFVHTLTRGRASHSYGLVVARRAGVPQAVIENARTVLPKLASRSDASSDTTAPASDETLREKLASLDITTMTPLEALQTLAALQKETSSSQ